MKQITNLVTINTSYSKSKAARILMHESYECLFMDFTRNQEGFIREIAHGIAPELIVDAMEPEDIDINRYRTAMPLFKCLPALGDKALYCYKEDASLLLSRDAAVRILILTAKAKMGKIEVSEWKEVLKDDIFNEHESASSEAEYIADRARERNICLDATDEVLNTLSKQSFHIKNIVVDTPCKPLDILGAKLKREILGEVEISDEEVEHLVKEHVRFVDMIIEQGYDQAYRIWAGLFAPERE